MERKRLWSRFRSQIGLTPKRAARLVRFDHAAHLLAAGNAAAQVAAASGYVDQAHLHREVKAFTGVTPTAVAAAPWLAIDDVAWPTSLTDLTPSTSPIRQVPAKRAEVPRETTHRLSARARMRRALLPASPEMARCRPRP